MVGYILVDRSTRAVAQRISINNKATGVVAFYVYRLKLNEDWPEKSLD
jgi:hypothetical protein